MTDEQPVWRRTFDAVERTVAPPLTDAVNSEAFAVALGLATRLQRAGRRRSEQVTRRMLHQLNLPAGSDITRLMTEIGKLQAQVRELSRQLEAAQRESRSS